MNKMLSWHQGNVRNVVFPAILRGDFNLGKSTIRGLDLNTQVGGHAFNRSSFPIPE